MNCPKCKGAKQLATLGHMMKDCEQCKGVGYVDLHEEPVAHKAHQVYEYEQLMKKKKKVQKYRVKPSKQFDNILSELRAQNIAIHEGKDSANNSQ